LSSQSFSGRRTLDVYGTRNIEDEQEHNFFVDIITIVASEDEQEYKF
jgi:hypothetical protein